MVLNPLRIHKKNSKKNFFGYKKPFLRPKNVSNFFFGLQLVPDTTLEIENKKTQVGVPGTTKYAIFPVNLKNGCVQH
jgi:hypothetical protein